MKKYFLMTSILFLLASCSPKSNMTPALSDAQIIVTSNDSQMKVIGEPFKVPMDNCGGATILTQSQEKSRTFRSELDITVSDKVASEIGGSVEVATAKLSREIGLQLGIKFGTDNTYTSRIEVPVEPGTQTITTLQWKEEWVTGTVTVVRPDGSQVDILPFSALNDVVLMQLGIETIDCKTGKSYFIPNAEQPTPTAMTDSFSGISANLPSSDALTVYPSLLGSQFYKNPKTPSSVVYQVNVLADNSYLWKYTWCAQDENYLRSNLNLINLHLFIENEQVPDQAIYEYRTSMSGWECNIWATLLDGWRPKNNISVSVQYSILGKVFDGKYNYEPGQYRHDILVIVQ